MLLTLDEHNEVIVTEKFLLVKDLRKLADKYKKTPDTKVAHFACLFYMYHFDSHLLWEYRDDEVKRLAEVRKFIHNGNLVKICNTMQRAMKTYKTLYNMESVSLYLSMRDNMKKLKEYMSQAVLVVPVDYDKDNDPVPLVIESKELILLNKTIPEQWKILDTFERELQEYTKSKVDVYGGGELGAYE